MAKTSKTKSPFKIEKRGNGRFQVKKRCGGYINGEEKVKILVEAGFVKLPRPAAKEAPAAEAEA